MGCVQVFLLLLTQLVIQTVSNQQNQDNLARKAHHLVMVAGHSVTISGNLEDAGVDERVWYVDVCVCCTFLWRLS